MYMQIANLTDTKEKLMYKILFIVSVFFLSNTVNAEYIPSGVCKSEIIFGIMENGKFESGKLEISSKFTERYMLGVISFDSPEEKGATTLFMDRLLSEGVFAHNDKYRMVPEAEFIPLVKGMDAYKKKEHAILSLNSIEQLTSVFPGIRKTYELGTTPCGNALCRTITLSGSHTDESGSANFSGKVLVDTNRTAKAQETPWSLIKFGDVVELTLNVDGLDQNKKAMKFNFSFSLPSCISRKFEDSEFIFDATKMTEMTKAEFEAATKNPVQKRK